MVYPTEEQIDARLDREYGIGPVSEDQRERMDDLRSAARELAALIITACPNNRARSLALTNLQQAKMWAVQAVVDEESG